MVAKPYNNGEWSEARFKSFIKGGLRALTRKWGPKNAVRKAAWRARGVYLCAGHERRAHRVPLSLPKQQGKGRTNNLFVDHIDPIIDPAVGFTTWDNVIERMFCEAKNLQVLCKECHDTKTKQEREQRGTKRKV